MHLVVLLMFLANPKAAPKTYDLALNVPPKAGEKSRLVETNYMKITMLANGSPAADSEEKKLFEATEVVVQSDGEGNAVLKRQYEKAQHLENGEMTPYAFEGKSVTVTTKKGEGESFAYSDGGEIEEADLEVLKSTFSSGRHDDGDEPNPLKPEHPVKVGESWSPDLKAVGEMFDKEMASTMDTSKSSARFTLKSVEKRNGAEYGQIDGRIDFALRQIGPVPLDTPIVMSTIVDMNVVVDNSSSNGVLKMKMSMKGSTTTPAGDNKMKLDIDMLADNMYSRTPLE